MWERWLFGYLTSLSQLTRGGTVVKVLCYKSEGRWFDPYVVAVENSEWKWQVSTIPPNFVLLP